MGDTRQNFAIVEYEFMTHNQEFNDLSHDLQAAYLRVWVGAVDLRRDVFSKAGIERGALAHQGRVNQEVLCRLVDICCKKKAKRPLMRRQSHGSVKLCGVYNKHRKLSGWSHLPWPGEDEGVSEAGSAATPVSDLRQGQGQGDGEREKKIPPTPQRGEQPASRALTLDEIARGAEPFAPIKALPPETRSDLSKIARAKADATRGGPPLPIGKVLAKGVL